jgi:hypothetical protein
MINFIDVVEFLSSGGNVGSPLGSMLEKVRDGTSGTFNSTGINNEEFKIMSKAAVLRCVDGLRAVERVEFESCPSIRAFARKTNSKEGALVLSVLGAYHKWSLKSKERGLVEIYRLAQRLDPSLPDPEHDEDSLSQGFRTGKTKKARDLTAKLLRDSTVVIDGWINKWNEDLINKNKVVYLNKRRTK